jgi:hypothetical protein
LFRLPRALKTNHREHREHREIKMEQKGTRKTKDELRFEAPSLIPCLLRFLLFNSFSSLCSLCPLWFI